jgi:Fe-S cluster assembly protein SufD
MGTKTENDLHIALTRDGVEQLSRSKGEPEWMRARRVAAWELFEQMPMPARTDEEWRRTDIRSLDLNSLTPYAVPTGVPVDSPLQLDGKGGGFLTHSNADASNSALQEELAGQGVILTDLDTAVREHPELVQQYFMTEAVPAGYNKFAALNGAFWSGGTFLYVPAGVDVALPVRSLYTLNQGGVGLFTHTLVVVESNARVTYIEEYASTPIEQRSLNAGVVEVFVRANSRLTFVTLQEWQGEMWDLSVQRAMLDRDAQIDWLVIGMSSGLTKTNIEAAMRGRGSRSQMLGILWGEGRQHTHYHTVQDHIAPNTTSDLLYKGALTDEARSIFTGTIRVVKGANGTDAYQANRNLMLSPTAKSYPSPNLEIEANEVRCTHGATVGKVDEDQLFYLMSRGLPREQATRIIVEGFFEDVLGREPVASIRDNLRQLIARKMDRS